MREYYMCLRQIEQYREYLIQEERSAATVEKYIRDVTAFYRNLLKDSLVSKEAVVRYKQKITAVYAVSSANSMLASINSFLRFVGWEDCRVKQLKVQRQVFCGKERELSVEEYRRLLTAAEGRHNTRLYLVMQTICATGIRVSELRFTTVEALKRGRAEVSCKGKRRVVLIPKQLCRRLLQYTKKRRIANGCLFVTRSGTPLDRSNIWSDMKRLCEEADVAPGKVFPHSLRHLFARTYYHMDKDISHLADVLGHSSIDTTRIYVISSGWEHEKQLERMRLVI